MARLLRNSTKARKGAAAADTIARLHVAGKRLGEQARAEGKAREACPFGTHNAEHLAARWGWLDGWDAADSVGLR